MKLARATPYVKCKYSSSAETLRRKALFLISIYTDFETVLSRNFFVVCMYQVWKN